MARFVIRNDYAFTNYVKHSQNWRYFLSNKREGVKITIRKHNVFLHISQYYCVLCNDLASLLRSKYTQVETDKKSYEWICGYCDMVDARFHTNNVIK